MSAPAPHASFKLDHPIVIAGKTIHPAGTEIKVRKPGAGELRGLTLLALSQLDSASLETLAPRITTPVLSKPDVAAMDPADFMQFGGEVMDFLLPTAAKPSASPDV
ncbi:MAG: phage tail protein [Sphingomonas bacterium]|nr:phage tail assembly protein [Sphingomonas bacterium]MDB5690274.1 phage tail protein [Sphingomonas bacterium]